MTDTKKIQNDGAMNANRSIDEKLESVASEEEKKILEELKEDNQLKLADEKEDAKNSEEKSQKSEERPGTSPQPKTIEQVRLPMALMPGDVR
jgi:hypothetical protein